MDSLEIEIEKVAKVCSYLDPNACAQCSLDKFRERAEAAEQENAALVKRVGELEQRNSDLRNALERLFRGSELYMKCHPWRDADECFSEARRALAKAADSPAERKA